MSEQSSVSVDQFYWANVDRALSPRGKIGYQIYRASNPGLTEFEAELGARLSISNNNELGAKSVFFALPDGCYAIARVMRDPRSDQYGRAGLEFAHGFVLSADAFESIHFDPFQLLDDASLWITPQTAVSERSVPAFEMQPLSVTPSAVDNRQSLAPEAERLFTYALRYEALVSDRRPVFAAGSEPEVSALVRRLFTSLPIDFRRNCAFDTDGGGGPQVDSLWLVGGTKRPMSLGRCPMLHIETGDWTDSEWLEPSALEARYRSIASADCYSERPVQRYLDHLDGFLVDPRSVYESGAIRSLALELPAEPYRFMVTALLGSEWATMRATAVDADAIADAVLSGAGFDQVAEIVGEVLYRRMTTSNERITAEQMDRLMRCADTYHWSSLRRVLLIMSGKPREAVAGADAASREDLLRYCGARLAMNVERRLVVEKFDLTVSYRVPLGAFQNELQALMLMLGVDPAGINLTVLRPSHVEVVTNTRGFDVAVNALINSATGGTA